MGAEWPSGGGGGGGAPSGPAGGDLSGTYPNPGIGSGVIVNADVNASAAIAKSKLAALAIVDADVSAISPGKVTGTAVVTADARLSDTRTPTDATVTDAKIATTLSPSKITGTAVVTADARLSDARTPLAHQSSHLPSGSDALVSADSLLNGSAVTREAFPRGQGAGTTVGASVGSGIMAHTAIVLYAGDVVTSITMLTGGAAAVSPTNWWFALYDNQATPALLSQTADQLTTAMPANTIFTLALGAPQTISTTGVYYVAWMVKAGTVASWLWRGSGSNPASNGIITGQKRLQGSSGSGLTTTAPGTIATPSSTGFQIWAGTS